MEALTEAPSPFMEPSRPSCSSVSGPVKQMGCHTLLGFILINIHQLSAVQQRAAWRQEQETVFAGVTVGEGSGGSARSFSPGAWLSMTAHVLLASALSELMQTCRYWCSASVLCSCYPLGCVIFAPAVTYAAGVIVHGVDSRAQTGASVNPRWAGATSSSPLISPGLAAVVSGFVPVSAVLVAGLSGWNHSSFYSLLLGEVIYQQGGDLHQLFRWAKAWGKANTSWFNWKASMLRAAKHICLHNGAEEREDIKIFF